jgi:thiol:disulfide interchange protein DsbC
LHGKEIPPPSCESDQVDKNIALAEKLGIKSTPTLILPDGRVYPGFRDAAGIVGLLNEPAAP